mmetsp:Transcript_41597/g.116084  ORF Transcript_41597/g.116084 Transcript_41597/m.116084 type:complete len:589 (+) Transcript_41597:1157-2923(+)
MFVALHVRDAIHHQAAGAVGTLVDSHLVPHLVELVRGREAGGSRPDDRNLLACAHRRRDGLHPPLAVGFVDDHQLHGLDGHRVVDDAEGAGRLAGGRADAARELREVVGLPEAHEGRLPVALLHQRVPLGDQVAEGAARPLRHGLVAEGGAAVHAPRGLCPHRLLVLVGVDLHEVPGAGLDVALGDLGPGELHEAVVALEGLLHVDFRPLGEGGTVLDVEGGELESILRGLPVLLYLGRFHGHVDLRQPGPEPLRVGLALVALEHRPLEVRWEHTHELGQRLGPPGEDVARDRAAGQPRVRPEQLLQVLRVPRIGLVALAGGHASELHHLHVHVPLELELRVPHPRDAAAHAGGEVAASDAEHRDAAACHVLAAMVPDALDHGPRAAVPDREALRADAAHEGRALRRAVQADVADDDVLLRLEAAVHRLLVRVDGDDAAAEALPEVVLRVALQLQEDALAAEGAEGLAARALQLGVAGASRQRVAPPLADPGRQHGAHGSLEVAHARDGVLGRPAGLQRALEGLDELCCHATRRQDVRVVLLVHLAVLGLADAAGVREHVRWGQELRQDQRRLEEPRRVHRQDLRVAD